MRFAAIDIGTNTVRLLISDIDASGHKTDVARKLAITRLGEGVDKTGAFSPNAMTRTLAALADFGDFLARSGVEAVKAVATSAARDADNSAEFTGAAARLIGAPVDIVSGETEAEYAFLGATVGFPFKFSAQPVLVFDVGGGSTELIYGRGAERVAAVSLDIGSVRLSELFVRQDPPGAAEIGMVRERAAEEVARGLKKILPAEIKPVLIGVAGTVTTIKAVELEMAVYDTTRVHLSSLTRPAAAAVLDRFLSVPLEKRKEIAGLEPERADVIIAGTVITLAVMDAAGADGITVSESDIIDGTLFTLAAE